MYIFISIYTYIYIYLYTYLHIYIYLFLYLGGSDFIWGFIGINGRLTAAEIIYRRGAEDLLTELKLVACDSGYEKLQRQSFGGLILEHVRKYGMNEPYVSRACPPSHSCSSNGPVTPTSWRHRWHENLAAWTVAAWTDWMLRGFRPCLTGGLPEDHNKMDGWNGHLKITGEKIISNGCRSHKAPNREPQTVH